jgi:hypothetical protein
MLNGPEDHEPLTSGLTPASAVCLRAGSLVGRFSRVCGPSSEASGSRRTEQVHGNVSAEALGRDHSGVTSSHNHSRQPTNHTTIRNVSNALNSAERKIHMQGRPENFSSRSKMVCFRADATCGYLQDHNISCLGDGHVLRQETVAAGK